MGIRNVSSTSLSDGPKRSTFLSKVVPFNSFGLVSPQTKLTTYTSYSGSSPTGPLVPQFTRMTPSKSGRPGGLAYTDIVLSGDFFICFYSSHSSDYYNALFLYDLTYTDFTHYYLENASRVSDYGYQSRYGAYITPTGFNIWDGLNKTEGSTTASLIAGSTTSGYIGIRRSGGTFYTYYSNTAPGASGYSAMTLVNTSTSSYTKDVRLGMFVHDASDYLEVYSPGTYLNYITPATAAYYTYTANIVFYVNGDSTTTDKAGRHTISANGGATTVAKSGGLTISGRSSDNCIRVGTAQSENLGVSGNLADFDWNGEWTVEYWCYDPGQSNISYYHLLIADGQTGKGTFKGQFADVNSAPYARDYSAYFYSSAGGALGGSSPYIQIPQGVWTHVAWERDSLGNGYAYQNGVLVQSIPFPVTGGTPSSVSIGGPGYGSEYQKIYFDELVVTKKAKYLGANFTPGNRVLL